MTAGVYEAPDSLTCNVAVDSHVYAGRKPPARRAPWRAGPTHGIHPTLRALCEESAQTIPLLIEDSIMAFMTTPTLPKGRSPATLQTEQAYILSAFTQHTNSVFVGRLSEVLVMKGKGRRLDTLYAMLQTEDGTVYEGFGHPSSTWLVCLSLPGTLFTQTPV